MNKQVTKTSNTPAVMVEANYRVLTASGKPGKRDLVDAIHAEVEGMRKDAENMISRAVKIGQYLQMAKTQAGKGFKAWCESHAEQLGFGRAMAYQYLSIGEAGKDEVIKLLAENPSEKEGFSIRRASQLVTAEKAKTDEETATKKGAGKKGGAKRAATRAPQQPKGTQKPEEKPAQTKSLPTVEAVLGALATYSDADMQRLTNGVVTENKRRADLKKADKAA